MIIPCPFSTNILMFLSSSKTIKVFLLQRCHTSLNSLLNNSLSGGIKVALVATNADFNEILTHNSRKDATK